MGNSDSSMKNAVSAAKLKSKTKAMMSNLADDEPQAPTLKERLSQNKSESKQRHKDRETEFMQKKEERKQRTLAVQEKWNSSQSRLGTSKKAASKQNWLMKDW